MSRRTSEANKAICKAWNAEQKLVQEGKGTRDWTPDQQKDILEKGKAYDEKNKAFEGHHMLNVDNFPEYQGNPQNIEFLSRSEHLKAHDGNYQKATFGYYDYSTGKTRSFENGNLEPCLVIELSNPIANFSIPSSKTALDKKVSESTSKNHKENVIETNNQILTKNNVEFKKNFYFRDKFQQIAEAVSDSSKQHHTTIKIISVGVSTAIGIFAVLTSEREKNNNRENQLKTPTKPMSDSSIENDVLNNSEEVVTSFEGTRNSPDAHMVSPHSQRYNGVLKEKAAYSRGGKK